MPFLKNNQYKDIYNASKEGNAKAAEIMQALRKGGNQEDLDRMVGEFYDVGSVEPVTPEQALPEANYSGEQEVENQDDVTMDIEIPEEQNAVDDTVTELTDLMSSLDKDFDGVIDENEIDDTTFSDFLKNKHRDGIRAKKNSDYFKAYSPEDREMFMNNKIDSYKNKFNNRLRDIDRRYRDMDGAIGIYSQKINEYLDDDKELDSSMINNAYDEITDNEDVMHGFGRGWDEQDTNSVVEVLKELVSKYGKKNIIAALNTLKSDNENYKNYLNGQVDTEIGRYSKSIENLLK